MYQYSPLDSEKLQIRLVELQPGSWSDDVRCTVKIVDFAIAPAYECLSYVWGDAKVQRTIHVDGKPFNITGNLWLAMRRLRQIDAPRVLWVDAISIHQEDGHEKTQQVQMMGDIYKKCRLCIIWLGEDSGIIDGDLTSAVAQQVVEMLHILSKGSHLHEMPCFSVIEGQRTDIPESYKPHFLALVEFLSLPWWRRIWIIQEMALPKTINFVYSSEEFSYDVLRSAVETLNSHAGGCCKDVRTSLRAEAFDPLLAVQEQVDPLVSIRETQKQLLQTRLSQLRRQFHASEATNVKDLFYGLLGLVTS
ncbi:heterokaryon incompatibility [Fusarium sporotrichioides]|uniref:Heterokaryon incompatibility n=1 Tax=Fusarium sporotrichioides TaxID=5514 RepID=A0A395SCX9_FUSSP|nr:heterokaryon incompatibility [Fusarium sporotrichioides]